jgi:hypothetical protein
VSSALLRFADTPAIFTATTLLRGSHAVHLQLICEGRAITISERRVLIESGRGETHELPTTVGPFLEEDRLFVEAIRSQTPSAVLSTYADALQTHRLCCTIRDLARA